MYELTCFDHEEHEGSPMFHLAFALLLEETEQAVKSDIGRAYSAALPACRGAQSLASTATIASALEAHDFADEDGGVTVEMLDCALFLVQSRVHRVGAARLCLVPLCDMFNHAASSSAPNVECRTSSSSSSFSCHTTREVQAGNELLVVYLDDSLGRRHAITDPQVLHEQYNV